MSLFVVCLIIVCSVRHKPYHSPAASQLAVYRRGVPPQRLARDGVTMVIASDLFTSELLPLNPKFPRYASGMFNSTVSPVPFDFPYLTAELINGRFFNATQGAIDSLVTSGERGAVGRRARVAAWRIGFGADIFPRRGDWENSPGLRLTRGRQMISICRYIIHV